MQAWSEANPQHPYKYVVYPRSKISAFCEYVVQLQKQKKSKVSSVYIVVLVTESLNL